MVVRRGEIWWARLPGPAKTRPVVILSRNAAIQVRALVIVAAVTRTIRAIPTEVPLGKREGLPQPCVVNADVLFTTPKSALFRRIGALAPVKLRALELAVKFALSLS